MAAVEAAEAAAVEAEQLPLIAHEVHGPGTGLPIVPAPPVREWMTAAPHRNPLRCLPMLMANSHGWWVLARSRIVVAWTGGPDPREVVVFETERQDGWPRAVESTFGLGIVSMHTGYVFRTPPGWDLLFTEPTNSGKDGIRGLSGIVETSWNPASATVNWKFTRPNQAALWEPGEPIVQIVPIRHRDLERFAPEIRALDEDAELQAAYRTWSSARDAFRHQADRDPEGWQRDYQRGEIAGVRADDHLTRLRLRPFTRAGAVPATAP